MFVGGQGTLTVVAANSPYTVQAAAGGRSPRKDAGAADERHPYPDGQEEGPGVHPLDHPEYQAATRHPLTERWEAAGCSSPGVDRPDRARYAVRLFGPQGLVWEQPNLPQAPLPYPSNAPSLNPGVVYRWELETKDFPVQQGQFSVLSSTEIAGIRETLSALEPGALPGLSQEHRGLDARGVISSSRSCTLRHERSCSLPCGQIRTSRVST